MTSRDEFLAAVTTATEGTPYAVTPTPEGFDLHLEIADASWYGLFNKAGLKEEYVIRVRIDGSEYTVEQGRRSISWAVGAPTRGEISWFKGRTYELEKRKVWALDESFRPSKVVDYSFSSNEGLKLVKGIGQRLGLKERWPLSMKIALVAGAAGASSIVLVPLALLAKGLGWLP